MHTLIEVNELEKVYQTMIKKPGVLNTIFAFVRPSYKFIRAVDKISFKVQPGEIIGYIGPNGAGKSTTIKILTGILSPNAGSVTILGMIPWKERKKYVRHIGVVFGQRSALWWDLPVIDSMELMRSIYRIPYERYKKVLDEFIDLLDMGSLIGTPARSLSLGQMMRANLCAAMLHEPKILFLDEPTIGLDVVAKERIRQFIRNANQERNTTIILTTHDISDVEKLCERVIIIDQGKKLFDGKLQNLVSDFDDKKIISVTFAEKYDQVSIPEVDEISINERQAVFTFSSKKINTCDLVQSIMSKYKVNDISIKNTDLETVIRNIYENRLLYPGY